MKLIGLTGQKGSGKDSVAAVLAEFGYVRVAFADPLKGIARVLGWDGAKEDLEPCPCCGVLRGRALLQVLGTEGVRANIRDDAWLLAAEREIARHERVVITDVRFLNEAEFVHAHGGQMWRIVRPGYGGDGHASETEQALIAVEREITNNRGLAELADTVRRALGAIVQGGV